LVYRCINQSDLSGFFFFGFGWVGFWDLAGQTGGKNAPYRST
jgi:hypothetical protein